MTAMWTAAAGLYFAAVNLAAFILMGVDKRRAAGRGRRIPERRLFAAAWLGGGPGGWAGMKVWRHKTKHARFVWGMPVIAAIDITAAIWFFLYQD